MSATDEVTFKIGDSSYPFVFPDAMTFPEQRELKRMSGGMPPKEIFQAMQQFDPDAWCAVMIVCMRRVDPSLKDNALDQLESPMPLAVAILGDYEKAALKDAVGEDAEAPLAEAASAADPVAGQLPAASTTEPTPESSGVPA